MNTLYLPELREMLSENDHEGLLQTCTALHPARTAEYMEGLTSQEAWAVLMHVPRETRAEIFGYFDEEKQIEIIEVCDPKEISELIADLPPDDRVDLLNNVDDAVVKRMLPLIPIEERRDILRLGAYPEGTAGAVMTSEVPHLLLEMNVGEAFDRIKTAAADWETIFYIYIVDEENHLRGVITARQLLSHVGRPETPLESLMESHVFSVEATDDQEEVAEKVAQYDLLAIPVVDNEHRLLGIITHDDIIDVVKEEAKEDAHRSAAVDPLEDGYLQTSWLTLIQKRLPWLIILFFTSLTTAFALSGYESELQQVAWLAIFIPLITSSGGNSGNQSATLIITSMTMGNVSTKDFWHVLRREFFTGITLGGALATLSFFVALTVGLVPSALGASVVFCTVFLVVLSGTFIGAALPIIFRSLGLDPTYMSNPFVAGIVDIMGILIYMNVARLLLGSLS